LTSAGLTDSGKLDEPALLRYPKVISYIDHSSDSERIFAKDGSMASFAAQHRSALCVV